MVGSAQIGFNQQMGAWVWGVEADIQGSDINGSQSVLRPALGLFPNLSGVTQDMDWFGTLRLRGGYAAGNWLFYGTGGLVPTIAGNVGLPAPLLSIKPQVQTIRSELVYKFNWGR